MIWLEFNKADYRRYMGALNRIESRSKIFANDLSYRNAVSFYMLLLDNLFKSGSKYNYPLYRHRYAAWKKSWGNFWRLDGDLVKNIIKRRIKDGWTVGINDVMDQGGKSWFGRTVAHPGRLGKSKSIGMYATVMEFGGNYGKGGKHPPRPLFNPTREEYAQGEWPKKGKKALQNIKGAWR